LKNYRSGKNRRGRSSRAANWFFVCCVVLSIVVALKVCVPDIGQRVRKTISPVIEGTADYKAAFTYFGEALAGDGSFTDVFAAIFNMETESN